uniref:Uncharacterized protein n=1 Tax=Anguilla anguilla TaxID=7936 RepID=A0A0E9PUH3_ANGAN
MQSCFALLQNVEQVWCL